MEALSKAGVKSADVLEYHQESFEADQSEVIEVARRWVTVV